MDVKERGDWNQFKQIFFDHWEGFKRKNPLYDKAYYDNLVEKMLGCGNPEGMGHIEYRCLNCGEGRRLVSMGSITHLLKI